MRISDWSSDVCSSDLAAIRARLASELRDLTDEDRSVALSLCALVAQDAELRAPIQEMMRRRIARVLETSSQPRGALLAFLAIEGLMALEWLGLHRWPTEERGADRKRVVEGKGVSVRGVLGGRRIINKKNYLQQKAKK